MKFVTICRAAAEISAELVMHVLVPAPALVDFTLDLQVVPQYHFHGEQISTQSHA